MNVDTIVSFFADNWDKVLMSLFTALLAYFTYLLWRSTRALWRETQEAGETARKSAEAAKTSADAVMLAERAYVKMSHEPPGVQWCGTWFRVQVEVRNHGRTPASVTDVKIGARALDPGELLQEPFPYPERDAIPNAFLVADEVFYHEGHFPLRGSDGDDIQSGAKTLWVYGHVDYIDTFGTRHRSGYVRVYRPVDDPLIKNNLFYMTEARYNYDRPRTTGEGNDWDAQQNLHPQSKAGN